MAQILLASDNPQFYGFDALAKTLGADGHTVIEAHTSDQAKSTSADLVVTSRYLCGAGNMLDPNGGFDVVATHCAKTPCILVTNAPDHAREYFASKEIPCAGVSIVPNPPEEDLAQIVRHVLSLNDKKKPRVEKIPTRKKSAAA